MVKGGMYGERGMCGRGVKGGGACMAGVGHMWQGRRAWWWEHAWQERQPLQRTVRMLLECILVDDGYGPIVYLDLH